MKVRPLSSAPLAVALVAVLASTVGVALTAAAEEPADPPSRAIAPLLHGKLELGMSNALRMGLENNLDVEVERYAPLIADYDLSGAWGAYDPEAFASFEYRDARDPTASALVGSRVNSARTTGGEGGLRGLLPLLSTSYEASFGSARRTSLSAGFDSLSPEYRSTLSLSARQPLLKNLIWNEPWTQVRTTRILLASSEEEFHRAVMDVVQRIEDAYWTLVAEEEGLRVAQKSLETARALLGQTETQYEVGVVSKVEVTEAVAGLAQREVALIRAENGYRNQQDVLIDLVLGPNLRAASTLEIVPVDRPEEFIPYEIDVESAVARAFERRPELVVARREVERGELQLQFAKNQRLPQLDAEAGYIYQGLSGRPSGNTFAGQVSRPSPAVVGNYRDSFDDYFDDDLGRTWFFGGLFSVPLPNNTARSTASRRELELRRASTQMRRLEQQIIIEVRQAARNLKASQEGIGAASKASAAAAEQLRAEEIRLEYGESTPFDVLQREEDLVDREVEEIEAYQVYRTSVTALDRAQGTILRNRNIEIADVAPLR